ncbi:tetratricopeptide repeat protein [Frankia nepalensis]|uniref:tetratricopeptide repeat protein n=1 Tax=Frankia nepalensis TaxID=1836974 RepID=UPI002551D578|nr:tetratricopeptide repeat protein [Frankia nepalensis]
MANLGDHQAARTLAEDTLARHRRVLGDDHPDTLHSERVLDWVQKRAGPSS